MAMNFDAAKLERYFAGCLLRGLPTSAQTSDSMRLTVAYFCVSGLDILGKLSDELKQKCINWVYGLQIRTKDENECGGFRPGAFLGAPFNNNYLEEDAHGEVHKYDHGHITMTYTALCLLRICGDDYSKLDKRGIINHVKSLQQPNGCFSCHLGCESDLRFLYCAAAISKMLDDFSGIEGPRAVEYIKTCMNFDGGMGLNPGLESHGGATYCGVAALSLLGCVDQIDKEYLISWCLKRQIGGFQGRPEKPEDTCYSFWVVATLDILGQADLVEFDLSRKFTYSCQDKLGGFAKTAEHSSDPLHAYLGLCGLSISKHPALKRIRSDLGFCIE